MKRIGILLLIVGVLLLGGCVPMDTDQYTFILGYSTPSLQNPFWISVSNAMREKADAMNVGLTIRDAARDTAKQAADIEDLIEQDVDVLLITPYDSVSLSPVIEHANQENIPVIIVDIGINDPDAVYESLIITDNYTGGMLAGEWLVQYFASHRIENPTVATIEAQLGAENARERHRGFIDVMEQNDIDVVLGRSANSMRDEAMTVMEDFLQSYPDLTAVFAECDDMALGALQAVKQSKTDTIIIGYDGIPAVCDEILAGANLRASIDQKPYEMGAMVIEMAVELMQGEELSKEVVITPMLITEDNADEVIQKYGE